MQIHFLSAKPTKINVLLIKSDLIFKSIHTLTKWMEINHWENYKSRPIFDAFYNLLITTLFWIKRYRPFNLYRGQSWSTMACVICLMQMERNWKNLSSVQLLVHMSVPHVTSMYVVCMTSTLVLGRILSVTVVI